MLDVYPVFTGYTDKDTMLRVIVTAPICALLCGVLSSFLLASLKKHLRARSEKVASIAPKFTREQIKALPPSEIIEVLIKLRYIKAQHRAALLKMLDEGSTKIWNFFDVFFSSTKGHNLALATLYVARLFRSLLSLEQSHALAGAETCSALFLTILTRPAKKFTCETLILLVRSPLLPLHRFVIAVVQLG
jgi:hypothetical protein